MTHSVSVREIWEVNHFDSAHIINNFVALIETLWTNEIDPRNAITHKSLKKQGN